MPYVGYAFILLVCLEVILVCLNKVNPKVYPLLLYLIGAGLVLMTTLAGPYLVGSDIHLEYYYAQLRAGRDVLQPIIGLPQGTVIISYLTDNMHAYKVVYPLLFSLVPPILYLVSKKFITDIQAFLASFFFIIFPAFSMELPGIVRQMAAGTGLATLLYLLVVSKLRTRYKVPLIVLCSILLPLFHYATAVVAIVLLAFGCILGGSKKLFRISVTSIIIVSSIYFSIAEGGAVAIRLGDIYNSWTPSSLGILGVPIPKPEEALPVSPAPPVHRYEPLVQSGLGVDLAQTTTPGKVFRILQLLILVVAVIGLWKLRKNKAYWALGGGGLLLCSFLLIGPNLSSLLNITRFLHLALFTLAPAVAIVLKPKYLLLLLIPYFLFTSGVVFEVTKQPNIETINIPYSVGLSTYRMDLGATITKDDIKVRDYIYKNTLFPVYSDINGATLLDEVVGWRGDLNIMLGDSPIPLKDGYMFIRSGNAQDGTFTTWIGVGCRKYVDPKEYYGIDINSNIIYQSGDARVIKVGG